MRLLPRPACTRMPRSRREITSIELLRTYIHLRYVDLSKNAIRQVAPLVSLQHLLSLNLSANAVSSMRALEPLPYLQVLNVSQNRLLALDGCSHPMLEHLIASCTPCPYSTRRPSTRPLPLSNVLLDGVPCTR